MSWKGRFVFAEDRIDKNVSESPGVYQLEKVLEVVYIGSTESLQTRLREHLHSGDQCIKGAAFFRYLETKFHEETKNTLLQEYRRNNRGRSPECNKEGDEKSIFI